MNKYIKDRFFMTCFGFFVVTALLVMVEMSGSCVRLSDNIVIDPGPDTSSESSQPSDPNRKQAAIAQKTQALNNCINDEGGYGLMWISSEICLSSFERVSLGAACSPGVFSPEEYTERSEDKSCENNQEEIIELRQCAKTFERDQGYLLKACYDNSSNTFESDQVMLYLKPLF